VNSWAERSAEERALLNPSFCAAILWHAARGYAKEGDRYLTLEESFLILPLVLHRETRLLLPSSIRTSLPVWLDRNPLAGQRAGKAASLLAPFTREALLVAGLHGFIALEEGRLRANGEWSVRVTRVIGKASDEVRACADKANFVGRWFAKVGSPPTVLALIGVRP